jgi:hypothetical protein
VELEAWLSGGRLQVALVSIGRVEQCQGCVEVATKKIRKLGTVELQPTYVHYSTIFKLIEIITSVNELRIVYCIEVCHRVINFRDFHSSAVLKPSMDTPQIPVNSSDYRNNCNYCGNHHCNTSVCYNGIYGILGKKKRIEPECNCRNFNVKLTDEFCDIDYLAQKFGKISDDDFEAAYEIEGEITCRWSTLADNLNEACNGTFVVAANRYLAFLETLKSDFTITLQKRRFKCHRSVLMSHSVVIKRMLEMDGVTENVNNELDRTGEMTEDGLQAFLRYLYYSDLMAAKEDAAIAFELLRTAHFYEIECLEDACTKILKAVKDNKFDCETLLDLYLFTRNVDKLKELKDIVAGIFKG